MNWRFITLRRKLILLSLALCTTVLPRICNAGPDRVQVVVGTDDSASDISPSFAGLSYETGRLLKHEDGWYFNPTNKAFLRILHTLNIKSLRVGGNSVDDPKIGIPDQADVDNFFAFAKLAEAKVIYSFRLKMDADAAVPTAKYIYDRYSGLLDCFCIGNEPEFMFKTYEPFDAVWKPQFEAICKAVPAAKFGGPSSGKGTVFAVPFASEYGSSGRLSFVSTHHYFLGRGTTVGEHPEEARENFLSDQVHEKYQEVFDTVAKPLSEMKLTYRFDETNSCSRGGARDASNTFAAALWAVDYMHWWAARGFAGMNFHTGEKVPRQTTYTTPFYSFFARRDDLVSFDVYPMAYAMLTFEQAAHGHPVPVRLSGATKLNFDAYAFEDHDHSFFVTLINKTHAEVSASLELPPLAKSDTLARMDLTVPNGDISAKEGLLLGGSPVAPDGSWSGRWSAVSGATSQQTVPAASVCLLHYTVNH